jgi:hypothetical protein
MRHHARFCALAFVVFVFSVSADFNHVLAQTPTPTPVQPGQVVISELRLRGPAGAEDEFVEIYNNTDLPIVVAASDQTAGWSVWVSNGQLTGPLFTIPNGTTIPARGHYLGANSNGYSLCNYPSGNGGPPSTAAPVAAVAAPCLTNGIGGTFAHTIPDATWAFDVPDGAGLALFSSTNALSQTAATRLDAFGFTGSPALYREGAGFPTVITLNSEHTYYRDQRSSTPRDTGDNAADFLLVGTNGGVPGIQTVPHLGAPGPENLNSPPQRNADFTTGLLDPSVGASQPPNRARDFTSDPANNSDFGTLLIRRTLTNNTGLPVSRLRFRVIIITTLGSPASECGGALCADLRARDSVDSEVSVNNQLVQVRGLNLEDTPPEQPAGGGYNSSLSADFINLETPLGVGQSINVEFRLGVMRTGPFRFFVNIEAQNSNLIIIDGPVPSGAGVGGTTGLNKKRRVKMSEARTPGGAAEPSTPAAAPRTVYVPLFIDTRPRAPKSTGAAEDKAGEADESKEREPKQAQPAADGDASQPSPAATRRDASKKRPAAAKAPRRGDQ